MPRWREDPATVRPMLASLENPPLVCPGWVYEPKYDGIRAIVDLRPAVGKAAATTVAIYSRNGNEKHAQFPEIVDGLERLARGLDRPLVLDGEIVAIDRDGRPLGFQFVQGRIHLTSAPEIARAARDRPAALILFDLLRDGDDDLRGQPLAARRLRLQERIRPRGAAANIIRLSEVVADNGRVLYERAKNEGWEGLIVKDGHSVYQSGRRTPAWKKLKLLVEQEFVIGGWTEPRQTRQHFGALLVGYYDDAGALRWAGSVGTGFDRKELDRVAALLARHEIRECPFADRFRTAERPHWVRPELVAQIRFTEWTSDGLLRQPVYLGMRTDKRAKDVRRELSTSGVASSEKAGGSVGARTTGTVGLEPDATTGRVRLKDTTAGRRHGKGRRKPDTTTDKVRPKPDAPAGRRLSKGQQKPDPVTAADRAALLERLKSLEEARQDGDLALPNGDTLHVTNLAKLFWPALGITKGELLRYYVEVAPLILPAVDDRPLVMKRFPNGIDKPAFYQQRHPEAPPPGVRREVLPEDVEPIDEEGPRDRLVGGSLTTLLYMAQLAAISQDPWFSRVADPMHADYVAIDLDPSEGAGFDRVLDVARWVKDALDRFRIPAWPKTSGSRGLHIYIPLPPRTSYDTGQLLCQMIATIVAEAHPRVATIERMVKRRARGTVYVDYLQNILGKTLATAYSARASDYAGVSTPLTWKEVAEGLDPRDFTIRTAPARFREKGDLWKGLRDGKRVDLRQVLRQVRG
jgi:bifunctional non-homologous end joining protein LigD